MTLSSLKNGFELTDKFHTIQIDPLEKEISEDSPFIITKQASFANEKFIISNSGDYELSDISVSAFKVVDAIDQTADLYRITIENVKVLFVRDTVSTIHKDMIEQLGTIHVLIFELDPASIFSKKVELVREIEPYFVCINSSSDANVKSFEKEFGENGEVMKKLKVKSEDFNPETDEIPTKLVVLG